MRITFILPPVSFAGGIRVVAIYADRLQRRGHLVNVISVPGRQPSFRERISSLIKGKGWLPSRKPEPSYFDNMNVPHQIISNRSSVTDKDVPDSDVVVATWWETAEWVARLSASKGVKAYFIQGYEVFECLPKDRVVATYTLPLKKITVSKWLADLMENKYGDSNVSLVFNSVDTGQFYSPPRSKQQYPTIGMLYSKAPSKGCRISLDTYFKVSQRIPNSRLVAFGAAELDGDLPLPNGARFYKQPNQSEIKDIYAQCDVWISGSFSEGFNLPILEAMACRCPVVSTAVGCALDKIENGLNGYVVPIGDSIALAERLFDVLSLPDNKWQKMSDAAYACVKEYTWEDATDLFEEALRKIVSQKNGD